MSDRTDEIKQNNPEPVNIVEAVRRAEPFTVFIVSDDESDGIFPAEDYVPGQNMFSMDCCGTDFSFGLPDTDGRRSIADAVVTVLPDTNEADAAVQSAAFVSKTADSVGEVQPEGNAESGSKKNVIYNNRMAVLQWVYDVAASLVAVWVCLTLLMTFVVRQATVDGNSMRDTLADGQRLLVDAIYDKPQYGDIVIISHGEGLDEVLVKRVIATEGQHLKINYRTGQVSVDGVLLHEDYILGTTVRLSNGTQLPEVIPEGYVFVMGDNREHSTDSRSQLVGLVPVENIIGKAVFRVFPLNTFGGLY